MKNKKYKIAIDARIYSLPGGLGRYTRELINGLERIDQENEYYIFIDKEGYDTYQPKNPNFKKILADIGWYGFSEQLRMPSLLNKIKPDLIHYLHFNKSIFCRKKYVITIHDLTYSVVAKSGMKISKLPPIIYNIKFLVYEQAIKDAIKRAKKIIVPSYNSKKDIISAYKLNDEKVAVTYESVSSDFSPDERKDIFIGLSEKFGIKKEKFFIYVGNASPHKNLKNLILAFDIICRENKDVQLVLAGKKEKFYTSLEEWVKNNDIGCGRIVFTGVVSDDELKALLVNSYACTFPSLAEGFGIPPLEAMASGTPVLTSATSCLPEVFENSVIYFNPYLPESIAEKMDMILENKKMREEFIKKGFEYIKKFSWEKMAMEVRDIYLDVLEKKAK